LKYHGSNILPGVVVSTVSYVFERDLKPYVFFSSRICHDLNNIITGAQGALSLLEFKVEDLPQGAIDDDLRRLSRSMEQFTQFSRKLETIFLQAENQPILPYDLLRLAEGSLRRAMKPGLTIDLQGEPFFSQFRVEMVQDALVELLTNAAESQPKEGRIEVRVLVEERQGVPTALLRVKDTGRGIPAEALPGVFEPFRSLHKRGNLVGLGFSLVGSVMAAHGGFLELESEPGSGTTVTMGFPEKRQQ